MIGYGVTFKECLFEVVWYRQCESDVLDNAAISGCLDKAEKDAAWIYADMCEVRYMTIAIFSNGYDVYATNGNIVATEQFYTNGYAEVSFGRLRHVLSLKKLL